MICSASWLCSGITTPSLYTIRVIITFSPETVWRWTPLTYSTVGNSSQVVIWLMRLLPRPRAAARASRRPEDRLGRDRAGCRTGRRVAS